MTAAEVDINDIIMRNARVSISPNAIVDVHLCKRHEGLFKVTVASESFMVTNAFCTEDNQVYIANLAQPNRTELEPVQHAVTLGITMYRVTCLPWLNGLRHWVRSFAYAQAAVRSSSPATAHIASRTH